MVDPGQQQLVLPVQLSDDATLENFLAMPRIQPLVNALRQQLSAAGEAIIYLYGPAGCGKSHLLQASCHQAGAGALYLPLAELRDRRPEHVLEGIEVLDLLCLDDVHRVLGDAAWETALFDLCNRARQRNARLLVAGDAAPRALAVGLADLRSRLGWGLVFHLAQGDDETKSAILRFRATRRGMSLPPEVASYIVSRAPRDLQQLLGVLDELDKASLVERRALSIPFVKQVLG